MYIYRYLHRQSDNRPKLVWKYQHIEIQFHASLVTTTSLTHIATKCDFCANSSLCTHFFTRALSINGHYEQTPGQYSSCLSGCRASFPTTTSITYSCSRREKGGGGGKRVDEGWLLHLQTAWTDQLHLPSLPASPVSRNAAPYGFHCCDLLVWYPAWNIRALAVWGSPSQGIPGIKATNRVLRDVDGRRRPAPEVAWGPT